MRCTIIGYHVEHESLLAICCSDLVMTNKIVSIREKYTEHEVANNKRTTGGIVKQ